MHKRVTITIDEETLRLAEARVAAGDARSLSAFVADATARYMRQEALANVMADIMNETDSHPTEEQRQWAREALGL